MRRGLVVLSAAVALALPAVWPASSQTAPVTSRAFSVDAAAFPVEPAPGTNQTALATRPAASQVTLSNPPVGAYGRAAMFDLGTIELYTGPPPEGSVAECDATRPNLPREAHEKPGAADLRASCDETPKAQVAALGTGYRASGLTVGGMNSAAVADASTTAAVVELQASADEVEVGPLRIAKLTFRGAARASGTPGGARAEGRVSATGATVDGTPVTIDADGIEVDRQKVPLELIPAASAAVAEAMKDWPYSDVRLFQPRTEAAADGTRATVDGGGLRLLMTNADPTNNYFLRFTLVGGSIEIRLGPPIDDAGPSPAPAPAGTPLGAAVAGGGLDDGGYAGPGLVAPPVAPAGDGVEDAQPVVATGRSGQDLAVPWGGWPWLVAVAAALVAASVLARRRVQRWWEATAERYVRG